MERAAMTDEPFRWWSGIPLSSSRIVNMHPEGIDPDAVPADTLTLRKLYDAARNLPDPHPLAGLEIVHYASNMKDAARAFVEEYNKPPRLHPAIIAVMSELLPPGHMIGLRRGEVVMIAGPEKEGDAAAGSKADTA
jgi:hypothetical protein